MTKYATILLFNIAWLSGGCATFMTVNDVSGKGMTNPALLTDYSIQESPSYLLVNPNSVFFEPFSLEIISSHEDIESLLRDVKEKEIELLGWYEYKDFSLPGVVRQRKLTHIFRKNGVRLEVGDRIMLSPFQVPESVE